MLKLEELITSTTITCDLLMDAHMEYRASSDATRSEFVRDRISFLKSHPMMGAMPYDWIHVSSGTTGEIKHYPCGPSTYATMAYWRKITLLGAHYDNVIHLNCFGDNELDKRATGGKHIIAPRPNGIDVKLFISLYGPLIDEANFWRTYTDGFNKKVAIQLSPYSLAKLLHYGMTFKEVPPEIVTIYSTFAPPDPKHVAYLMSLGLEVRNGMRVYDGGASFFTCQYGGLHWDDILCRVWTDNDDNLISDDLTNMSMETFGYSNGDKVRMSKKDRCLCNLDNFDITFLERSTITFDISGSIRNYDDMLSTFMISAYNGLGLKVDRFKLNLCVGYNGDHLIFVYMFKSVVFNSWQVGRMVESTRELLEIPESTSVMFVNGWVGKRFKESRMFIPDGDDISLYEGYGITGDTGFGTIEIL